MRPVATRLEFDHAQRAGREAQQKLADILVLDGAARLVALGPRRLPGARGRQRPLVDEGAHLAHDLVDVAHEREREGQHMAGRVAQRAGARELAVMAPAEGDRGIRHQVEVERAAEKRDRPQLAHQLPGMGDGGVLEVVEAHQRRDAGGLHRIEHGLGLGGTVGERLLAIDVLAGLGRGDGDLGMRVVGRGDVDDVDVRVGHELAPVGGPAAEPQLRRLCLGHVGAHVGYHLEHRHGGLGPEHHDRILERRAVGRAHPAGADHPDPDLAHRRLPWISIEPVRPARGRPWPTARWASRAWGHPHARALNAHAEVA